MAEFLDTDDGDVGKFARRRESGIAEGGDDGRVVTDAMLRQRIEHGV